MSKWFLTILILLLAGSVGIADESETDEPAEPERNGDASKPKTLSGMSILGNEEAPKSLVIVPWKSSELGEDVSLTDTLDDRPLPVEKEVFLRELRFYEIRSGEKIDDE